MAGEARQPCEKGPPSQMGFGGQPSPAASQRAKAGSGGGSCTHGGEAYEAHLNLILPAVKLVESVGNAPTSTCLQGRCIACLPRPHWQVALVLPQAGWVLETLPHRLVRDLLEN